uniref:Uncharacterized protein n=1 Tax=Glossina palpalis gambiensis TaxID=67801 RepID=A0A1B0AYG5_9MUSC
MTMQHDVLSAVVNYVTDQQLGQPAESTFPISSVLCLISSLTYIRIYVPSSSLLRDGESMKNAINSHLTASFVTSVYGKKYPVE